MPFRLRDRDKGYKRIKREILKPASTIQVGIQGDDAEAGHEESDELTVAEIANQHEYGLGVPERSWLRAWFDENEDRIRADLRRAMQQVILGRMTQEKVMETLGLKYVGEIQARIADGIAPENSPGTIAEKGSSTPLVDTGQLKAAITSVLAEAASQGLAGGLGL